MPKDSLTKQEKLENVFIQAREKLWPVFKDKTGKFRITLELNLSQGGVGDSFIETNTRERLKNGN